MGVILANWARTAYLRSLLKYLGPQTHISYGVYFRHPSKISIGGGCEIRRGCGLYGNTSLECGIRIGNNCRIKEFCILDSYGGNIELGEQVLLGQACTIHGHGGVVIGEFVLIGAHTCVFSNNHRFDRLPELIQHQGEESFQTVIGRNTWIGSSCVILAGVSIGENSVIGAGAVVSKDIPAGSLAVGVPARVIRPIHRRDFCEENRYHTP